MLKSLMNGLALVAMMVSASVFAADEPNQTKDVKSTVKRITNDQLATMLTNFGYEPRNINTDKQPIYRIHESRHGLKIPMNVSISTDKSTLWIQATLLKLPETLETGFLRKLLTPKLGKTHFVISGKVLRIQRPVDNIAVTPKSIRTQINYFLSDVNLTKDDWLKKKSPATSLVKK